MLRKNSYLFAAICIFALLTTNFQCEEDVEPLPLKYEFADKLKLYPLKQSYQINDTIWVEFPKANKELFDMKSSEMVSLDTGMISFSVNVAPLYDAPVRPADGFGDFVVYGASNIDSFNHDVFGIHINKACSEPDLHFKIGFVPKYKGYYAMPVGNNVVTSCRTSTIGELVFAQINYRFDIADNGKAIYLEMPETVRRQYASTWVENSLNSNNIFYFKVE